MQKKYNIIYADPPWHYRCNRQLSTAEKHYPTMSLNQILELPVSRLADKDCVLFLWITFPQLDALTAVLNAWGFTYKTVAFVWIKQNKKSDRLFTGLGFWTRSNAEICILAIRGHPKRISNNVHQVIFSHIEEHSKKPEEAKKRIVQLMGDLNRIELFARQATPGWDIWGNEVENSITFP